ncbi:MAG: hypothetical protein HGA87_00385 [Desulfobulbaceae bacterium]|nr:hypothetical protein [Desulfobulbaceae bacterium]
MLFTRFTTKPPTTMPKVSLFRSTTASAPPDQNVEFLDILHQMRDGYFQDEFIKFKTGKIRKNQLPCFTASAAFSSARKRESLQELTGFINIEIDSRDNTEQDLAAIRNLVYKDRYTFAGHLSASGKGISLYVRINEEKHTETFLALEQYYASEYKLIIDPQGKEITQPRFVVYDPDLYINDKAQKFTKSEKKEAVQFLNKNFAYAGKTDVEYICMQIERECKDITASYHDWASIAWALNSAFGSEGELFFHRISALSPRYDPDKCSEKYQQCSSAKKKINSFFAVAKKYGCDIVSPQTREVLKTAKYAKKSMQEGTYSSEAAKSSTIKAATEIVGMDADDAEKLVNLAFSGAPEVEKESTDEIYEWITKDIEAKKLKRNLITDCIEYDGAKLTDRQINAFMVEFRGRYGSAKVKKDVVLELIDTKAKDYHPIFDFIDKHKHRNPSGCIDAIIDSIDGQIELLSRAEAREFRRCYIEKWLLGMMSGWYGTYSLLTLVLVGDQMAGKSRWYRGLLPEELREYYAEAEMDGDKDHLTLMSTKAIIMDDEFSGKTFQQAQLFKKLSSKQEITIRKPYARMSETYRRIAALCGTTNDESIKNDATGNRRIIPINVSAIDWEKYDSVDKTDLIIEIYHKWREVGDGWMLTREDADRLNIATDRYKEVCPEDELVAKYFDPPDRTVPGSYMTNTEVMQALSKKIQGGNIRIYAKKLGQVLKNRGYQCKSVKRNGQAQQCYAIQERIAADADNGSIETKEMPF